MQAAHERVDGCRLWCACTAHHQGLGHEQGLADQLEAGQIFLNGFAGLPIGAPFGGVKQSGFGRMGGRPGLEEFLRPKNVYVPLV